VPISVTSIKTEKTKVGVFRMWSLLWLFIRKERKEKGKWSKWR